jgi:hypothetical protein
MNQLEFKYAVVENMHLSGFPAIAICFTEKELCKCNMGPKYM